MGKNHVANSPDTSEKTIERRLEEIKAELGMPWKDLAKEIGVSASSLYKMKGKHAPFSANLAIAFERRFGFRAVWIMYGEGRKRTSGTVETISHNVLEELKKMEEILAGKPGVIVHTDTDGSLYNTHDAVPCYGLASPPALEKDSADAAGFVVLPRSAMHDPEQCAGFILCDHGMAPRIPAGAVVVFDRTDQAPEDLDGELVVVRLGDAYTVRRLRTRETVLLLESANPDCETDTAPRDNDGNIIGRVVWVSFSTRTAT
jgi:SOS-response transcriptional repressor LexA